MRQRQRERGDSKRPSARAATGRRTNESISGARQAPNGKANSSPAPRSPVAVPPRGRRKGGAHCGAKTKSRLAPHRHVPPAGRRVRGGAVRCWALVGWRERDRVWEGTGTGCSRQAVGSRRLEGGAWNGFEGRGDRLPATLPSHCPLPHLLMERVASSKTSGSASYVPAGAKLYLSGVTAAVLTSAARQVTLVGRVEASRAACKCASAVPPVAAQGDDRGGLLHRRFWGWFRGRR